MNGNLIDWIRRRCECEYKWLAASHLNLQMCISNDPCPVCGFFPWRVKDES